MIIAVKDKDRVLIGFTNVDYYGGALCEEDYADAENVAIRFADDGSVLACADMRRESDVLLYDDRFVNGFESTAKDILRGRIPYMKALLEESGCPLEDGHWKNALVICNNERIFVVDSHFGFLEAEDFACYGGRVEVVRSVLDDTAGLPAEERILKAVNFCKELFKESFFPLVIADTKSKEWKVIREGGSV